MNAFDWIKTIAMAMIVAIGIRTFLFTSYEVRGDSMVPSVHHGERLIVSKWSYLFSEPKRFDLIVFKANEDEDYIKRVIGLPGDRIRFEDDVLYINGEPVDEPFLTDVKSLAPYERYTEDFAVSEPVPEDHVFVLGDNRPRSLDSRKLGFIPQGDIVGKVHIRVWPLREAGLVR